MNLAEKWRAQADDMDRTAKAYRRSCVEAKAVQLILLAKQLRTCADAVERLTQEQAQAIRHIGVAAHTDAVVTVAPFVPNV